MSVVPFPPHHHFGRTKNPAKLTFKQMQRIKRFSICKKEPVRLVTTNVIVCSPKEKSIQCVCVSVSVGLCAGIFQF